MKRFKWIVLAIIILPTAAALFRGHLYRLAITYHSTGERAAHAVTNSELIWHIEDGAAGKDNPDVREIIKSSLAATSKLLTFSFSGGGSDPNRLIETGRTNCVGYAAMFSAICNYRLEKHGLSGEWKATPKIGHLYLFGHNVHHWFDSPFFKDHDFVLIENPAAGKHYAVDPSVNDYLYIGFVTFKPSPENTSISRSASRLFTGN